MIEKINEPTSASNEVKLKVKNVKKEKEFAVYGDVISEAKSARKEPVEKMFADFKRAFSQGKLRHMVYMDNPSHTVSLIERLKLAGARPQKFKDRGEVIVLVDLANCSL